MVNTKYLGAHVSSSGGIENAPQNAIAIEANAFAFFLKNQRQWNAKPFSEENISLFKSRMKEGNFSSDQILPHCSYLINLGHPESEGLEKSRIAFMDEIERCTQLELSLLNIHPGTHLQKSSVKECLSRIAESINFALDQSKGVTIVLENTAGQGSWVGHQFEDFGEIFSQVEDTSRVGVCLDTCHMHAAGHEIMTFEEFTTTMNKFDQIVGFDKLKGMHLNDCKSAKGSRVDRHESLGKGTLGIDVFKFIMKDKRFNSIPLILETPVEEIWPLELKQLHSFAK